MKNVVVFILGYRSMPFLKAGVLDSIRVAANNIEGANVRLVFLDNYSRDGSIRYIMDRYPDVDLLLATKNHMYCKGTNIGMQYGFKRYEPDYFILVDADNPCEPTAYDELVKFADSNTDCAMVQPLVKSYSDKSLLYSCGHIYVDGIFCRPIKTIPEDLAVLQDLPSCSISSTLVRTSALVKSGLLDPIFDMYYESSDLSFRLRDMGYKCACAPKAIAYNEGTIVSNVDNYHESYFRHRNSLIFWKKHDEESFNKLLSIHKETYDRLNEEFKNSEYCLDIIKESTRKGIEDGIKIASNLDRNSFRAVSIKEYEKSDAILLQSKR